MQHGIELHHAVGVWQAAAADARFFRIELDDRHAFDDRLEGIAWRGRVRHQAKGVLDACLNSAVRELVAVCR